MREFADQGIECRVVRQLAAIRRVLPHPHHAREHVAITLVPGATEAECLRVARRLPDAGDRDAFARMVRVWQYAAYARRLPQEDEFEGLLGELSQRFGWAR